MDDHLARFCEGLSIAISAARNLALTRDEPKWLLVGKRLEDSRAAALTLATTRRSPLEHKWFRG